uniref:RPN1 N-terminal domain-containing protein n=1 Tax=Oryza nivara TaxID=4536 RepID=A0A0E0IAT6_ORYNI
MVGMGTARHGRRGEVAMAGAAAAAAEPGSTCARGERRGFEATTLAELYPVTSGHDAASSLAIDAPPVDGRWLPMLYPTSPKKKLVKLPSGSNASKVTGPKAGPDQIDDTLEHQEEGVAEEDMQDKLTEHSVSQRLPLIIPDKVHRSKALIECDGDSIDLSGDVGAVGRIVISNNPNGYQDLLLDLEGTIYKSTIVPSRTFYVIEYIMNEFIQLEPQSNLFGRDYDGIDYDEIWQAKLHKNSKSVRYLPATDDMLALDIAYTIYMKFEDLTSALRIALLLDNKSIQYMKQVYTATEDLQPKKQFSFIIARHGLAMEIDNEIAADDNDKEGLQEIVNNTKLSEGYLTLARDIEVMEPKSLEDIYKVHLIDGGGASSSLDSARQNLAATFVNAFVNAGFGQDKLMTAPSDSSSSGASGNCLFKNKEHGKASAAASLGMILLWDPDSGLAQLDKYLHSNDAHVVAGALLGIGIALAILMEYINKDDTNIRIGAILGFGIAYAGSQKEELKSYLSTVLGDSQSTLEVLIFSAIALGLSIIFALMECNEAEPAEPIIRLLPVALGLLYLGKQESVEATTEVSKTFDEKIRKYCDVQKLLGICSQHLEKGETHQGPAVLGIALIAMAEELGAEMAVRPLERLLQYGEQNIRRAVPLALGILCISNPKSMAWPVWLMPTILPSFLRMYSIHMAIAEVPEE